MKFNKILTVVAGAFVSLALQAKADTITFTATDLNAIGHNVNVQQPYSGSFDLTSAGFSGAISGLFSFAFDSDGTGWKPFAVNLVIQGQNYGTVPFLNGPGPVTWSVGPIDVLGPIVNYTITDVVFEDQSHNFQIVGATLVATGGGGKPQVPDGGMSLILLGAGLSAVGFVRNSLKK